MSGKELYHPFETNYSPAIYEVYRQLRSGWPVYKSRDPDVSVISRYEDVQTVLRDWKTYSSTPSSDLDDTGVVLGEGNFIDTDPPEHTRVRDVIKNYFTPRALARRLESVIARELELHATPLLEVGEVDVPRDLGWPLPTAVMCSLLGLPRADRGVLGRWLEDMARREPGNPLAPPRARDAAASLGEYFADALKERQRRGRDDLLSTLVAGGREGRLQPGEAVGVAKLLLIAGTETTSSTISNAFLVLGTFPEQRAYVTASLSLVPRAIEEVLRVESPIQGIARSVRRESAIASTPMKAGERVLVLLGSANRDERRFEDADLPNVLRQPQRTLAFGEGIHHCIGAPLARLETRLVLEYLLPRMGDYEISDDPRRLPSHFGRALSELRLTFESRFAATLV
jgi:cytochrome P450